MFVTDKSFAVLKNLDQESKKMVAKVVNEIIDREGVVLYGTVFSDGSFGNFSTTQDKNDTHVVIAIAPEMMGILEPMGKDVSKSRLSDDDANTMREKRLQSLEQELHQARQLLKKTQNAKPSGGHVV